MTARRWGIAIGALVVIIVVVGRCSAHPQAAKPATSTSPAAMSTVPMAGAPRTTTPTTATASARAVFDPPPASTPEEAAAAAVAGDFSAAYLTVRPDETAAQAAASVKPWATPTLDATLASGNGHGAQPAVNPAASTATVTNVAADDAPTPHEYDLSVHAEVTSTAANGTQVQAGEDLEVAVINTDGAWKVTLVSTVAN